MKTDLVLEIGTEEIPARFIPGALASLKQITEERFRQNRLRFAETRTLGTPRRLALIVSALESLQEDREEVVIGPPRAAAFDPEGKPTKVALGFARSKGVAVEELESLETAKGTYLGLRKRIAGRDTSEVLSGLLPQMIQELPFPKTMRWGSGTFRFARPIHWILALYGERIIPFRLGEIASGNRTFGHRFMAPEPLVLQRADDYRAGLQEAWVVIDPAERRDLLVREIEAQAQAAGGTVLLDPELLQEVANLVEYPVPVTGSFEADFLLLPPEVLITSMKEHQRYFPLSDPEGRLINRFIAVNNTRVAGVQQVVKGHEKVLRARLADARFFFQEDTKEPLAGKIERLKGVVFHSQLGTSYEKVERVARLAEILAGRLAPGKEAAVRRCARLAKADLTSLMVGEFPSLQGVMGSAYARLDGEDPEVAQGIWEHYLPLSAQDQLPRTETGALVGLADRLDSLAGFFAIGQIPTGSADPFALRRQAQGVVLVSWGRNYNFPLDQLLAAALEPLRSRLTDGEVESVRKNLMDFFTLRLEHLLTDTGLAREVVEAVLSAGWNDFGEVRLRARALQDFQQNPDFSSLIIGCKRALNILKGVDRKALPPVDAERLQEPAEIELFQQITALKADLRRLLDSGRYPEYLQKLAGLRQSIDRFFDGVLVMAPEDALRLNRLAVLAELTSLFNRFAQFSQFPS